MVDGSSCPIPIRHPQGRLPARPHLRSRSSSAESARGRAGPRRGPRHGVVDEIRPASVAPGKYAYMYGSSQTGRTLRQILYGGFTIDERAGKIRRRVREDRRREHGALQRAFRARPTPGRLPGDAVPIPVPDHDRSGDRKARRDRRPHSRRPRAEDLPVRQRVGVLGQGPSRRAPPHVDRRDCGSPRRAQREGLLHGGIAARLRNGTRGRQRWTIQEQHPELRMAPPRPAAGARRLGTQGTEPPPSRHPSSRTGPWSRTRTQVPRHPRRPVADPRARRLSMGRRGPVVRAAVPASQARRGRQRDRRHPPAGAGGPPGHPTGWQFRSERSARRRPHRQQRGIHPVLRRRAERAEGGRSEAVDRGALLRAGPTTWPR